MRGGHCHLDGGLLFLGGQERWVMMVVWVTMDV